MKQSELVRRLKKAGCSFLRHGGCHDMWYSPVTGDVFMVPRHPSQEIARGTLSDILRKAGL